MKLILLFILALLLTPGTLAYALDLEEARVTIQTCNITLSETFVNVLIVENLGANVSNLLSKLDDAAALLEDAEVSLAQGQFNDVLTYTSHSIDLLDEVNETAETLRLSQLAQNESKYMNTLMLMIGGVSGFSVFMVFVWNRFKTHYPHRFPKPKSGVSPDEKH